MATSAQEIQDAVHKFLDGGSAEEIWGLACRSDDDEKPLVASAGVIPRLVDVLVRDEPRGEGCNALLALYYLVQIGKVAQDAIAQAHNGAIFLWLSGPQDHGNNYYKQQLTTKLTTDHIANSLLLDAVRGVVVPLAEVASMEQTLRLLRSP